MELHIGRGPRRPWQDEKKQPRRKPELEVAESIHYPLYCRSRPNGTEGRGDCEALFAYYLLPRNACLTFPLAFFEHRLLPICSLRRKLSSTYWMIVKCRIERRQINPIKQKQLLSSWRNIVVSLNCGNTTKSLLLSQDKATEGSALTVACRWELRWLSTCPSFGFRRKAFFQLF